MCFIAPISDSDAAAFPRIIDELLQSTTEQGERAIVIHIFWLLFFYFDFFVFQNVARDEESTAAEALATAQSTLDENRRQFNDAKRREKVCEMCFLPLLFNNSFNTRFRNNRVHLNLLKMLVKKQKKWRKRFPKQPMPPKLL